MTTEDVQLKHGDCLELMKEIPDESIDMILCDLPYGVSNCKWDAVIPAPRMWEQYKRIIKNKGAIVLFAIQPFTTHLIHSNMTDFRYCWYWKKNNVTGAPFAKVQPMRCIEDICVFYKHKPTYNPQGLKQLEKVIVHKKRRNQHLYHAHKNDTIQKYTNYPKNLIEFNGVHTAGRMHPTQKPVDLLEYLVKTYTNENDTVLDNCMGSGSTGEACINTNRKFIGIEKNLQYFEIAKRRLTNEKQKTRS